MRRHKGSYRDVVDPPTVDIIPRGSDEDRAPVESAVGGNGFLNHASAWDVLAGQPDCVTDLQDYLKDLDENPDLRAAATLRSMSRLRAELEKVPESCGLGDPVVLRVQDAVLLARQLLSRLR